MIIKDNYTISFNEITKVMIDAVQIKISNLINTKELKLFNKSLLELFRIIPRKMKRIEFRGITNKEKEMIKEKLGSIKGKFYEAWQVKNIRTEEKFDKFIKNNYIETRELLWHGSKNENWWSIIMFGLILKPAVISREKMFGKGIYFANLGEKSLEYTSYKDLYNVEEKGSSAFMGLYDTAYGKTHHIFF